MFVKGEARAGTPARQPVSTARSPGTSLWTACGKVRRKSDQANDGLAGAEARRILLTLLARLKSPQRRGPVAGDPDKAVPLLQSHLG
jgi:hypothetical protein